MKLSPSQWSSLLQWLDALLEAAADASPEQERAWVDAHAKTLGDLRPHLEQLLEHRRGAAHQRFLAQLPPLTSAGHPQPRSQVGPYRLLRELGRGGMAQVWLAERADGLHRRQVALKLPFLGPHSTVLSERFHRERAILSSLQHPHIASVLDVGSDAGQPWLALEFVEGQPITQFATVQGLGVPERVTLLLQVLEAVQHAHSKLVIHRDVKPSNVLVDRFGQVKLLDFGVAKLLDDRGAAQETELTQFGGRALTPQYSSPEQLAGSPLSTASDVYSLGLLAYELLTGALPYAPPRGSTAEMVAQVSEARLERPSSRVTDPKLARRLRGDLDTIVLKALRTTPAERYGSAEAMARDLERHLESRPILARPTSLTDRLRKTLVRHRALAISSALTFAALLAGLGGSLWQAQLARRQAQRAAAAKLFLEDMLKGSDARIARDKPRGSMTAKELLDLNVGRIETAFADDPETQLELLGLAGEIYGHLREEEKSNALLARQATLALALRGPDDPLVLNSRLTGVWSDIEAQAFEKASATLDDVASRLEARGLESDLIAAHYWLARGESLRAAPGRADERLAAFEHAIALYEALDPRHDFLVAALANAGTVLLNRQRLDEARAHYERALVVAANAHERDDSALAMLWGNLALIQTKQGDRGAVAHSLDQAVALARATTGPDDPVYWYQAAKRAEWANLNGEAALAEQTFAALLAHVPDDWSANTAHAQVWEKVGACAAAQGRLVEAKAWLERALPVYTARPYREFDLRRLRLELGAVYDELGQLDLARPQLTAALSEYLERVGWTDPLTLAARVRWARWLRHARLDRAAERELQIIIDASPAPTLAVVDASIADAELALDWADLPRAARALHAASATFGAIREASDVRLRAQLATAQCELLLAQGDLDSAKGHAHTAWRILESSDVPTSLARMRTLSCLNAASH